MTLLCHRRSCFKGHWIVRPIEVVDTMEHDGEPYALVKVKQKHEVICVACGAWIIQLGEDVIGWKGKAGEFLEAQGPDKVADAVCKALTWNNICGLSHRPGTWEGTIKPRKQARTAAKTR